MARLRRSQLVGKKTSTCHLRCHPFGWANAGQRHAWRPRAAAQAPSSSPDARHGCAPGKAHKLMHVVIVSQHCIQGLLVMRMRERTSCRRAISAACSARILVPGFAGSAYEESDRAQEKRQPVQRPANAGQSRTTCATAGHDTFRLLRGGTTAAATPRAGDATASATAAGRTGEEAGSGSAAAAQSFFAGAKQTNSSARTVDKT